MAQKKIESFFYRADIQQPSSWYEVTKNLLDPNYGSHTVSHVSISTLMQMKHDQRTRQEEAEFNGEVIVGEDKFLNFLSFLQENNISTRFQIEFFFIPDGHGMAFDFHYDTAQQQFKMVCFDSSKSVMQYDILKLIANHLLANKINYHIIACQSALQKDVLHCALFSYILLRETSKITNYYQHLVDKNSWVNIPTFQVSPYKVETRPDLPNVQWIPTTTLPTKVITSGQSFAEMKNNLPANSADNIITKHKQKFQLDNYNTYIEFKRSQYGKRYLALGNQFFNFETQISNYDEQQISPSLSLYFSELHTQKILTALNIFNNALFIHFGFFTQDKTWFVPTTNNYAISLNVTYKLENHTEILAFIKFLAQYGIECEAKYEYQMLTFRFSHKKAEINFLHMLSKGDVNLLREFLNSTYEYNGNAEKISTKVTEMFTENRTNMLVNLFNYSLKNNDTNFSNIVAKMILENLHTKLLEKNSWLHYAVLYNCEQVITFLLQQKIDPYQVNEQGYNAIDLAIKQNNLKVIEIFLQNNININHTNKDNLLPIHFISCSHFNYSENHKKLFNLLAQHTQFNLQSLQKLFLIAIDNNNVEIMLFCLQHKTSEGMLDIHQHLAEFQDGTYLHYAASKSKIEAMKCLTQHGANIHALNADHKTALEEIPYDFSRKEYTNYINQLKPPLAQAL